VLLVQIKFKSDQMLSNQILQHSSQIITSDSIWMKIRSNLNRVAIEILVSNISGQHVLYKYL